MLENIYLFCIQKIQQKWRFNALLKQQEQQQQKTCSAVNFSKIKKTLQ